MDKVTLDSLLLPGTPESVARNYRTLSKRAKETSFGLLESDLVVLDTETTGLSMRKDELTEIAAARITNGIIVERFNTFVNPLRPIPAEIQVLTGITDLDVCNAPTAAEAVAALAEFVGGVPIIAHNAQFDRSFVRKAHGGDVVSDVWIDSLALSRIALPRLRSHSLANMAQAFGCAAVEHRAMADVEALVGMWRIILLGLLDLPAGVLDRMANMHEDVPWAYRPILRGLAAQKDGERLSLRDVRRSLVSAGDLRRRRDPMEDGEYDADDAERRWRASVEIEEAFVDDGLVSQMYDTYERRPEQQTMAQEVCAALHDSTHRALEAGTGVGKSMAYLLPAIQYAQEHEVTVGIATKTIALTDQLVSHELPALDAAMPGGVRYCNLKGYDHYPCLRRVDVACVRELPLERMARYGDPVEQVAHDQLSALAVTMAFASQSSEGDLDALGIRWHNVPRDMVTTTPAECLRGRCPFFPNECLIHGARRRAGCSDVLVTNHALLLRSVAMDGAMLPPVRHWIVDEAHSFEQEARRQWAQELSAEAANRAFQTLGGTDAGVIHKVLTSITKYDSATLLIRLITKAAASVQRAATATTELLARIHDLSEVAPSSGGYDSTTLWIGEEVRLSDQWQMLEASAAQTSEALDAATKALRESSDAIAAEDAQLGSELADATRALEQMLEAVRTIVLEPDDTYVYSAELYRAKKRQGRERLCAQKFDVGQDLVNKWYPEIKSVTYTSATIAVGRSFEHFDHAVGFDQLPEDKHHELQLESSFDYDSNMSVVVARDMPAPNAQNYLDALEDLLFDVHRNMEGSVLTLFTNRREMERVYKNLRPRLAQVGLDLVCQERNSSPRYLRERFMSQKSLSLFALKSFWEGFDAAGDTLRCVVIPRLPFASPNDPLVCERELRDKRSWWRYSLPEAVLSVKQAAGRLIRSATDTGVLVLADSRVSTKRYGKTFTNALPTNNVYELGRSNIGGYLELWRKSHE